MNTDNGWVKVSRSILEWEWYADANTVRLFLHLILKANHKEKNWRGTTIGVGQLITSLDSLGTQLCLTRRQIRTALNKLKSTGEVSAKTTNKFTLITITNYATFQSNDQQEGKREANEGQAKVHQRATNKNERIKEDKNNNIGGFFADDQLTEDFENFWKYYTPIKVRTGKCVPRGDKQRAKKAYFKAIKEGARPDEILHGLQKYLTHRRENDLLTAQASTFLNNKTWRQEDDTANSIESRATTNGSGATQHWDDAAAEASLGVISKLRDAGTLRS